MSFIYGFAIEHGAHFVLKGRILPEHHEHGSRGIRAEHRETGCESPTQNGTVRCMFFPTAQQRGHSGETGEGFAERTGESPRTKSGYSVPAFGLAFPSGIYVSA